MGDAWHAVLAGPDPFDAMVSAWNTLRSLLCGCLTVTLAVSLLGLVAMTAKHAAQPKQRLAGADEAEQPADIGIFDD